MSLQLCFQLIKKNMDKSVFVALNIIRVNTNNSVHASLLISSTRMETNHQHLSAISFSMSGNICLEMQTRTVDYWCWLLAFVKWFLGSLFSAENTSRHLIFHDQKLLE